MRHRFKGAGLLTALAFAAAAAPAAGSVTVGQIAPGAITSCSNSFEWVQVSSPDNAYVIPAAGVITSWTHRSQTGNGQTPSLKLYRKVSEPASYQVVGRDGPEPIAATTTKTFPASVPVKAGDVLGITGAGGTANIGCEFNGQGDNGFSMTNQADGGLVNFTLNPGHRINVSAVLNPTNTFTLGAVARNKKKGTATVAVTVPNPGVLTASGTGVKPAGAAERMTVTAPGEVKVRIRATGKKKRKLSRSGKTKLGVTLTYTPTGGDTTTQSVQVKLKKKL